MPELPDVELYCDALRRHAVGRRLEQVRLGSPFVLRTVEPPPSAAHGRTLADIRRIGKRIVLGFRDGPFFVIHLMIAGRLRWKKNGAALQRKLGLAAFDFDNGTLMFTEAGSKKRASIHAVASESELAQHDPGGLEVLESSLEAFGERLRLENRTLKRALTDPRLFSGIGNAYSDEILHRAKLSPLQRTGNLDDKGVETLHSAVRDVLNEWTERHREDLGDAFPDKVTAFHDGFAAHGKYGKPCPVCEQPIQRLRYADNEANYCPSCQTDGKLLADRGLSRLLRGDWPRTLAELEELKRPVSE